MDKVIVGLHSEEWQKGYAAFERGDTINMSHEEYEEQSDEWKAGARYACEHQQGYVPQGQKA